MSNAYPVVQVDVLQYKGTSLISKAIKFQTRSPYSHTAIQFPPGTVEVDAVFYEAWRKGVTKGVSFRENHTLGTKVDVYPITIPYNKAIKLNAFFASKEGCRYDFKSIARFLSRREPSKDNAWFCSELVLTGFEHIGVPLVRVNPSMGSPRDVTLSTKLSRKPRMTWIV